jgi:AcrR family transcriptional regulator
VGEVSTKERILDAAEELFAEEGFTTSLRHITANAGVNLAAVNYHFGSKDGLIEQVFARRLEPLNAERLTRLDRIEAAAGHAAPPLEQILEAFVGPPMRARRDPRGATFMRLFGRTLSDPDDRFLRMFTDQFDAVLQRFSAVLGRALPHLAPEDIAWRILFMVGVMAHTMALSDKLPALTHGVCDASDPEGTLRRLVPFVAGGMRANARGRGGKP